MKTGRSTNLEILRIISMILIVMSHSDDWMGLVGLYSEMVCMNKFIADWLHIGGQIGVGCFLLISGYYMVDKQITSKKILSLGGGGMVLHDKHMAYFLCYKYFK